MKVLAIAASHRVESCNKQLLAIAARHLDTVERVDVSVIDYSAFDLPMFNHDVMEKEGKPQEVKRVHAMFDAADAFIIAMPEYNWSIPSSLKNVLDWMSVYRPTPCEKKPAFLMSATPSERGGMQGLAHLKTVFESINAFVYPHVFGLGKAFTVLDDIGLHDEKKALLLTQQLDGFIEFSHRMIA